MEKLPYRNPISVAGHRGNAKYFPENTMVSFRSAVALHPDMIELDVHGTKDGELVVMHDHKVDRTTDGTGFLHD
ncbi:MAG: glycerophosphodiester phosphodiesterase, partial [Clostridia bacterium]|nr:glycerophosphodiester phosphodiesterase [Clostridia bacterium]